jgi:4-hydroxyphenylpyruvate dioxygenase-like putative hemolysin
MVGVDTRVCAEGEMAMLVSKIGPIVQIAYVVEDIEEAIEHWSKLGVGPFFLARHMRQARQTYLGKETTCDISVAFAYSGDLQIELVQQHNRAPSVFLDFQALHGFGMQHVGVLSSDIAADTTTLANQGFQPVQHMVSSQGVETVFFDTDRHGGTVLELIQATPEVVGGFARMMEAAQAWDGNGTAVIEI